MSSVDGAWLGSMRTYTVKLSSSCRSIGASKGAKASERGLVKGREMDHGRRIIAALTRVQLNAPARLVQRNFRAFSTHRRPRSLKPARSTQLYRSDSSGLSRIADTDGINPPTAPMRN